MSGTLYNKTNYTLDIMYVSNLISEYDLKKANISALKYMGYLTDETYRNLSGVDKMEREIYIGKLERADCKVTELKKEGILTARRLLFESNNLQDNEILAIKNDAVFVIGSRPLVHDFGILSFAKKNVYTFFFRTTSRLEIFYGFDPLTGSEKIDVKGINDEVLERHNGYMIDFIAQVLYLAQTSPIQEAIRYFNEFYQRFVELTMEPGFYREFNSSSVFRIKSSKQWTYGLESISREQLKYIDISCNALLLRDIYKVLVDIYFNQHK